MDSFEVRCIRFRCTRDSRTATAGFLSAAVMMSQPQTGLCLQQLSVALCFLCLSRLSLWESCQHTVMFLCQSCKCHLAQRNLLYLYSCTACCRMGLQNWQSLLHAIIAHRNHMPVLEIIESKADVATPRQHVMLIHKELAL